MTTLFYRDARLFALAILMMIAAGASALMTIGRQEDPTITNLFATIVTPFPGADPARVEALVTEKIEQRLKEIAEIAETRSVSRLGVSVADETAESLTMGAQPTVQRTVTLTVEGHAVATAGVANVLDAVAAEVETALGGLLTVGSVEVPLMYTGASIEFSTDLDRPVGRVSLSFTADLFTVANQPEVLTQA
jgi:hypothetical protein